jgi:hypothetical protein
MKLRKAIQNLKTGLLAPSRQKRFGNSLPRDRRREASTGDDKWLRKTDAKQQFDGVTVSGSVGETPAGRNRQEHQRRL